MSPFESACMEWYFETVTEFAMKAGIVAESFRALRLKGAGLRIFTLAMNKINGMMEAVRAKDAAVNKLDE